MSAITQVKKNYQFTTELHELVQAGQEIAVLKMQHLRKAALETRDYMNGILNIYFDVHSAQREQISQLLRKKKQSSTDLASLKQVLVLFSTDHMFSGDVTAKVFKFFSKEVERNQADAIVIGKVGKQLFDQTYGSSREYYFADLAIENPDPIAMKNLLKKLLNYDRIDIFEGKYINLVNQEPLLLNLNGETSLTTDNSEFSPVHRKFLFEPSLEELVSFFQTQITATLFRLSLNESNLASLGSRITTLESSLQNLETEMEKLERRRLLLAKTEKNRKQLQRLAGRSLWS